MVGRQVRAGLRQHGRRASRPTRASSATARSARSGRSTCRPMPRACGPGSRELGPHLLGEDPRELGELNRRMDARAQGASLRQVGHRHGLLGHPRPGRRAAGLRAARRPLRRRLRPLPRDLAGGARRRWPANVAGYRAEGYRRFQLKVGGDPDVDIARIRAVAAELGPGDRLVADANTGWLMHEALRVVRAVRDVDVYIEQPCLTYEECLAIRRHTDHPFVLDEVDRRSSTCCCAATPTGRWTW